MRKKRVVIGGTFACDETLALPLEYLLKNAVNGGEAVELQWLQYGRLTNVDDWVSDVVHPAHPVDLILLLVRLSDLETLHPELHHLTKHCDATSDNAGVTSDVAVATSDVAGATSDVLASSFRQFWSGLEQYERLQSATAPLVVLFCPCPPTTTAAKFNTVERAILAKTTRMEKVIVQSTEQLLALFHQQSTTAFYDAVTDKRQHAPYTQALLNVLSLSLCRQICRLYRSPSTRKKLIVLDCDNTLWGGAVAEVGAHGIELTPRFLALQRFVVAQQQQGMLLALCSKNLLADVMEAFTLRREAMVLHFDEHVVAAKINWLPKSKNIAQLATELALGLDSFIFIDDNPLECHEVATALPSVTIIPPLGANFSITVLQDEWVFDTGFHTLRASSVEDHERTQLYQHHVERQHLCASSSSYSAFLSALGIQIVFQELNSDDNPSFLRVLQLHHRTNQFNTATTFAKRLNQATLSNYIAAFNHTVLCAHVTDRFGHYGLVSVALCQHFDETKTLRIDSFLLSCRALNRGVEHAMMQKLGQIAFKTGATRLEFSWEPTERNQPALFFFLAIPDGKCTLESDDKCKKNNERWIINATEASNVVFLTPQQGTKQVNEAMIDLLPQWKATDPSTDVNSMGLLRVSLRERESLEQFLSPVLHQIAHLNRFELDDDTNADKFRRKARHQTKLHLVKHTNDKTATIWSATRPYDDNQAGTQASRRVTSLHVPCQSPQCSSTLHLESQCAFQRCRTCCYRIQRLLTRSLHHEHIKARESAAMTLKTEFNNGSLTLPTAKNKPVTSYWCTAHQNKRRQGEMVQTLGLKQDSE